MKKANFQTKDKNSKLVFWRKKFENIISTRCVTKDYF